MTNARHAKAVETGLLEEWHQLLRFHAGVVRELDSRLEEAHRLSVREFDVLITLANAVDKRLAMSALASSVMLSQGGLSHLVDRLEKRALVAREANRHDGRSIEAALTQRGRAWLEAARLTHDQVILDAMRGRRSPASEKP